MGVVQAAGGVPVGTTVYFSASSAPAGFLKENGAAVSRVAYAALFAVIGTTYGAGDGATTFNLPDSRAEFIRCLDDGRGVDVGRALGASQADANKSHAHAGSTNSTGAHTHTTAVGADFGSGKIGMDQAGTGSPVASSSSGAHTHTVTIGADGEAEARPRNVPRLACIKY